jgi:hypothetical protein
VPTIIWLTTSLHRLGIYDVAASSSGKYLAFSFVDLDESGKQIGRCEEIGIFAFNHEQFELTFVRLDEVQ